MFDNEDIPTTHRPSLGKEAPEPEIQLANSTSPSLTGAEPAPQNTQEFAETPEEAKDKDGAPASHNTSSTEENTFEETATPELPINTTKENISEETAAPEPQQNEPATSLEEPETSVDAPEDEHSGTPPIQEDAADPPSPTIQVPRIQSEPLAVPTPSPTPVRPYVTVEDLLELRIASDPQISPNGTLIAFTIQQCHSRTNKTSSAIWLARNSADKNTSPWQISNGEAHDTTPHWSPDGNTLAFLSDRTGTSQIYLLSMQGGEAHQLSALAQDVTEYSWHPGGGTLLAHSAWKPIDDQPNTEPQPDTRVYTRLDGEHDGLGHQQGRHQQLWLIALNGQTTRLTAESVDLFQSCWSPDGTEIAFSANRRKDPDLNLGRAIWILTLRTGQFRRLTDEDGFACCPSWSPDGQYIAYIATADLTEAGNYVPWLVHAQGNQPPRLATQGADQLTCQSLDHRRTS